MKKNLLKLINDEVTITSFIPQLACETSADGCDACESHCDHGCDCDCQKLNDGFE